MSDHPADNGFVKVFDLSDSPAAKRAALEKWQLDCIRPQILAILGEFGCPDRIDELMEKARVAIQPVVDADFLAAVD